MALETKTKEIGGRSYSVTQLPSLEALDVFESLSKVAGPALAALTAGGLDGNLEPAAAALFSRLGGGQLRGLVVSLLKTATEDRNGKHVPVATLLAANEIRPFEALQIAAFAAEVNFQDFFDGARSLFAGLRPPASGSSSPADLGIGRLP